MPLPTAFNGRRLQKAGWTLPFILAFAPLAAYVAFNWLQFAIRDPWESLWYAPSIVQWIAFSMGPIPFGLCGFIGLVGFMYGLGYATSTEKFLTKVLRVSQLPSDAPLARRVAGLAEGLGLPAPKVGVMGASNAYAIGSSSKDAAVVIGRPLIEHLSSEELDAIIGHELGHVATGDMRRMQMAAGFQSMLDQFTGAATNIGANAARQQRQGFAAAFILLFGLLLRGTVFLFGELFTKYMSRRREFVADAFGALVTSPAIMADALKKVHGIAPSPSLTVQRYACLMFFTAGGSAFSTHPTLEHRLRSLENGKHLNRLVASGTSARLKRIQTLAVAGVAAASSVGREVRQWDHGFFTHQSIGKRAVTWLDRHYLMLVGVAGIGIGIWLGLLYA